MPSTGESLSGERRVVTALFCDVVGSTSIAETMDPEDWSEMVGSAMTTMGDVISRYGGTVTEFAGDGIVAVFGAPTAHEDDPYRAVRSGMEIVRA
ncbi:MAG: adenylate/guanylate cyclase domain-containing protein, partial [Actinomycetota bacterium]